MDGQKTWAEVPFGINPERSESRTAPVTMMPWDTSEVVSIPGTDITITGKIDRLELSGDRAHARVTDYKSGQIPKSSPVLNEGRELQRCLYAYAVKALIPEVAKVDARLLYPRTNPPSVFALDTPETVLERLTAYIVQAKQQLMTGRTLPGVGAADKYNYLAFALPAARSSYYERKRASIKEHLGDIAPLWEEV